MMKRKTYWAPLIAVLVVLVASGVYGLMAPGLSRYHPDLPTLFFGYWIFPLLLAGEGIVYYLIRKDMRARGWVWCHVGLMVFVCVCLFASPVISFLLRSHMVSLHAVLFVTLLFNDYSTILYGGGLILGQVVFLKVLFENFYERRKEVAAEPEGRNLLDDVAD